MVPFAQILISPALKPALSTALANFPKSITFPCLKVTVELCVSREVLESATPSWRSRDLFTPYAQRLHCMPPSILMTAFSISAKVSLGQSIAKMAKAKVVRENFNFFILPFSFLFLDRFKTKTDTGIRIRGSHASRVAYRLGSGQWESAPSFPG